MCGVVVCGEQWMVDEFVVLGLWLVVFVDCDMGVVWCGVVWLLFVLSGWWWIVDGFVVLGLWFWWCLLIVAVEELGLG